MFRDETTGKIDFEKICFTIFMISIVSIIVGVIIFCIHHDRQRSKLPEIQTYETLLDDHLNIEVWRKDRKYLNDTIIIVKENKIIINSIGDKLEILIDEGKVISYEIAPIYRVASDFFSSTLTNKVQSYVIKMKLDLE